MDFKRKSGSQKLARHVTFVLQVLLFLYGVLFGLTCTDAQNNGTNTTNTTAPNPVLLNIPNAKLSQGLFPGLGGTALPPALLNLLNSTVSQGPFQGPGGTAPNPAFLNSNPSRGFFRGPGGLGFSRIGIRPRLSMIQAGTKYLSYWAQNRHKYLQSLRNFHDKLQHKEVQNINVDLPEDPWALFGQPCDYDLYKTLTGDFVIKGEPLRFYNDRLKATSSFTGTCVQPNRLPVLECDKMTLTCTCQNATHTPLNFLKRDPQVHSNLRDPCLAASGSVCNGDYASPGRAKTINCVPSITCVEDIGICGGFAPFMENAFAGQALSFTELEIEEAVARTGGVENVLLDLQMKDTYKVGTPCNFSSWNKIARAFVRVIENLDSTKMFNGSLQAAFQDEDGINGNQFFSFHWNKMDRNTQRCLDYFPSMVCAKGRGGSLVADTCECGRISKWFNYTAVDGVCVAYEGSICTSMHGTVNCREVPDFHYRCSSFEIEYGKFKHTEVPSVLTPFDLKKCSDPLTNESVGNVSLRRAQPAGESRPQEYFQKFIIYSAVALFLGFGF